MMKDKSVPTKNEVERFFKLQDKIKAHTREVAKICTELNDYEEIESLIDDESGSVIINVWNRDCGGDAYWLPMEYLSMSVEDVKQILEDKKRKERERRKAAYEKGKAKREENKAKREAKKLEKERKEYERLKKKFEVEEKQN